MFVSNTTTSSSSTISKWDPTHGTELIAVARELQHPHEGEAAPGERLGRQSELLEESAEQRRHRLVEFAESKGGGTWQEGTVVFCNWNYLKNISLVNFACDERLVTFCRGKPSKSNFRIQQRNSPHGYNTTRYTEPSCLNATWIQCWTVLNFSITKLGLFQKKFWRHMRNWTRSLRSSEFKVYAIIMTCCSRMIIS